jgi:plastocyanin
MATEQSLNHIDVTGTPGHRNFKVRVGASADEGHVAIDEMFPNRQTLKLVPGDKVTYLWTDHHNIHSVKFPADTTSDPSPFGFDCASGYVPPGSPPCTENGEGMEFILDPGSTASGQPLTSPTAVVNAGLITGKGYGIPGEPSKWSVLTNSSTPTGTYTFHCTLHDFMVGKIVLGTS